MELRQSNNSVNSVQIQKAKGLCLARCLSRNWVCSENLGGNRVWEKSASILLPKDEQRVKKIRGFRLIELAEGIRG